MLILFSLTRFLLNSLLQTSNNRSASLVASCKKEINGVHDWLQYGWLLSTGIHPTYRRSTYIKKLSKPRRLFPMRQINRKVRRVKIWLFHRSVPKLAHNAPCSFSEKACREKQSRICLLGFLENVMTPLHSCCKRRLKRKVSGSVSMDQSRPLLSQEVHQSKPAEHS